MATIAELRDRVADAPLSPGVYQFLADGAPLYVGKATRLRERLRSHVADPRTRGGYRLLSECDEIAWTVTDTAEEAYRLEQTLIAQAQPRYNVSGRYEQRPSYVVASLDEDFPRLFVSDVIGEGRVGVGPFGRRQADTMLRALGPVLRFRTCPTPVPGTDRRTPCLEYHIGQCSAPCIGEITEQAYRADIDEALAVLRGQGRSVLDALRERMRDAAARQRYEAAARLRDRITTLEGVSGQLALARSSRGWAVAWGADPWRIAICLVGLRDDLPTGMHQIVIDRVDARPEEDVVAEYLETLAGQLTHRSYVSASPLPEWLALSGWTPRAMTGHWRDAYRLARRQVAERLARTRPERDPEEGLRALAISLDMPLPRRIECTDVSHLGGTGTVGARQVMIDGRVHKRLVRRFNIRTVSNDDPRAMAELLARRVARTDTDAWARPDLLVIDGGPTQLAACADALVPWVEAGTRVVGLAKQEEELYLPGEQWPLQLGDEHPGRWLLQALRDSTHDAAVSHQRAQRTVTESELDSIDGIGARRKRLLIQTFGSVAGIRAASVEEVAAAVGDVIGARVHAALHREGPAGGHDQESPVEDQGAGGHGRVGRRP